MCYNNNVNDIYELFFNYGRIILWDYEIKKEHTILLFFYLKNFTINFDASINNISTKIYEYKINIK